MLGVIKSDIRYDVFKDYDCVYSNVLSDFVNIDNLLLPFFGIDEYYNIKGTNLNLIDILNNNYIENIFVGVSNSKLNEVCLFKNINLIEMIKDNDFILKNSLYTASGIVDYLQLKGKSVVDQCIFIMGYGNISSRLALLLEAYGCDFVIYPNNDVEKKYILLSGYKLGYLEDLEKYNVIVNTIPLNFDGDYSIFSGCKILDVASSPFGFDVGKLMEFNIEYYIYSSIPSKYLIVSSRKLVLDFVRKYLQKCGF